MMKRTVKWLSLVMALVMALGLAGSALAYSDKNLEAPKAGEVVIDGDLSEWDTSKCFKIDSEGQIIDQIEHWDGVEDCSMEVYVMWDEENLYIAMKILDDTPYVYREGFPLDELDAVIFFLSTDPEADPARQEYTATDWRIVQSTYGYKGEFEFFNYIDREMIADTKGWETAGEYGDELVFDDYEAAIADIAGGYVWESKLPLHNLSNDQIPQLIPAPGVTVGFDVSILDVDLPCPGIHSLRIQFSSDQTGRDRSPAAYPVDTDPSLWATLTFVE
jgi:hypothetical protein